MVFLRTSQPITGHFTVVKIFIRLVSERFFFLCYSCRKDSRGLFYKSFYGRNLCCVVKSLSVVFTWTHLHLSLMFGSNFRVESYLPKSLKLPICYAPYNYYTKINRYNLQFLQSDYENICIK